MESCAGKEILLPPARATGTTGREVLPGLVSLEGLKAFRTLRQLLQPHPGGVCV